VKISVFGTGLLPASARRPTLIRNTCLKTLRAEKSRATGDLNIIFLDKARMRKMNRGFLNHEYDTDVIAFNYDPPAFGDVYISAHMARLQAKDVGHSVLDEVLTLCVHGTLHLLGYDDDTAAQRREMFSRQDRILGR
jgi:rRNA maturation RNase YbeY